MEDVEIKVAVSRLVPNPAMPGTIIPDLPSTKRFSVWSGKRGGFGVGLAPQKDDYLVIEKIEKLGYDWVIDWAWTLGVPPHNRGANRAFQMSWASYKCTDVSYELPNSDVDNPAIFPLQLKGNNSPPEKPSRGGWDIVKGKRIKNEPMTPAVPSAGKGAPRDQDEISARLKEYLEQTRRGKE